MRIGSVFFLMLLVLVGFGYLLSDNINTRKDLDAAKEQVAQTQKELKSIREMYDSINTENAQLKDRVAYLAQENILLQDQVSSLQEENLAINDQNAQLHDDVDFLKAAAPLIAKLMMPHLKSMILAIFIPIIPISLGTVYVLVRYNVKTSTRKKRNNSATTQRSVQVKLTEEEMKQVINMRRGR
jgi:cell division protein FtsB